MTDSIEESMSRSFGFCLLLLCGFVFVFFFVWQEKYLKTSADRVSTVKRSVSIHCF